MIEGRSDVCIVCYEILKPEDRFKEVQPERFVHEDDPATGKDCYTRFVAGNF